MIIIRLRRAGRDERFSLHLPGAVCLEFRHGQLNGQPVFAARHLDKDDPHEVVRGRMAGQPHLFVVYDGPDEDVHWQGDPVASVSHPPSLAKVLAKGMTPQDLHPSMAAALTNGWTVRDLLATGEGDDPTERGGVSARAGLCLAQMALCVPPPSWDEQEAKLYPWECEGWKAPTLDFRPGNVPPKAKPTKVDEEEEEGGEDEDEAFSSVPIDPDALGEVTITDLKTGEEVKPQDEPIQGMVVPADENNPVTLNPVGESTAAVELTPTDAAIEAGYPTKHAGLAVTLLLELHAKSGDIPSKSKMDYHLKKHELPKAGKAVYDALIQAL